MSLPLDLLLTTAEQLDSMPGLKALALTCKGLSEYCQRRIFKTIVTSTVVVWDGTWDHIGAAPIDLDALFTVFMKSRRLCSYVKELRLRLDARDPVYRALGAQELEEWFSHHLPQFFQAYLCPIISRLTELEILGVTNFQTPVSNADLTQSLGIYQAISSPFISQISIDSLPFAIPSLPLQLSELRLINAPFRTVGGNCKAINVESFSYFIRDPFAFDLDSSTTITPLKEYRDNKVLELTGLRFFSFGSRFDQDHHEAAQIVQEASGHLEELVYAFPTHQSSGGQHTSIPNNLLRPERRTLFEQAIALRWVTFAISSEDINEDLTYRGDQWPRVFTWMIQSLTVLSGCPKLEEIYFRLYNTPGPLLARLTDDWKRLNAMLVIVPELPGSLRKVVVEVTMNLYEGPEERCRLKAEWDLLFKDIFGETHEKTQIIVTLDSQ